MAARRPVLRTVEAGSAHRGRTARARVGSPLRSCLCDGYDFAVLLVAEETRRRWFADVAQLAAHLSCKQGVGGSSPPVGSVYEARSSDS